VRLQLLANQVEVPEGQRLQGCQAGEAASHKELVVAADARSTAGTRVSSRKGYVQASLTPMHLPRDRSEAGTGAASEHVNTC
jgi:hypothetical protein